MASNKSRAVRRSHRARLIKKYMYYEKIRWWSHWEDETEEILRERARYHLNDISKCSCPMCGNPRNNGWSSGKECFTMQERKANAQYQYELQEVLDINTDYGKEHRTDC